LVEGVNFDDGSGEGITGQGREEEGGERDVGGEVKGEEFGLGGKLSESDVEELFFRGVEGNGTGDVGEYVVFTCVGRVGKSRGQVVVNPWDIVVGQGEAYVVGGINAAAVIDSALSVGVIGGDIVKNGGVLEDELRGITPVSVCIVDINSAAFDIGGNTFGGNVAGEGGAVGEVKNGVEV
jgi:hypothetical protein